MGASIQLGVLANNLLKGIGLLAFGLIVGRMAGWGLSTVGSNWTWKERLFLLPGNSAKATVQAAIGAIPLSLGLEGGEIILAIAALSILITAPIGAWAIQFFAPKLLQQDPIDPTKISTNPSTTVLAVVNTSPLAKTILSRAAHLARRCNGDVIVLHVTDTVIETEISNHALANLQHLTQSRLLDIRYQFITAHGPIVSTIQNIAETNNVTEMIMGYGEYRSWQTASAKPGAQSLLETNQIPILVIENVRTLKGTDEPKDL